MGDDLTDPPRRFDRARRIAEEAFRIADADPQQSLELAARAREALAADGEDLEIEALVSWSRGLALRVLGKSREAVAALEEAVAQYQAIADDSAAAHVQVALSFEALAMGKSDAALAYLEQAKPLLEGAEAAQADMQRAVVLQRAGRVADSLVAFDLAVGAFEALGLRTLEAKARGNRGLALAYRGDYILAEVDLERARQLFAEEGDLVWSGFATHNLGFVAARRGNLPRGLRLLDEAQRQLREVGAMRPEMLTDRVETMLDAGLAGEARAILAVAIAELEREGQQAALAEACYLAARAAEEDGDPLDAGQWAERSAAMFAAQQRPRWELLAEYRRLRAELAARGDRDGGRALGELSVLLREAGWGAAALEAEGLAAALAAEAGELAQAQLFLEQIRLRRRSAPALARFDSWVAEARVHRAAGEQRRAERALGTAFGAFDDFRMLLGSSELRNRAQQRAQQAAEIGVGLAIETGRAERALYWLERARAGFDVDPLAVDLGEEADAALATLRDITATLEHDPPSPRQALRLGRQQVALEEIIRRSARHAEGVAGEPLRALAPGDLPAMLGDRLLIEYATVGDQLVAVVQHRRHSRLVELAPIAAIRLAVTKLRRELGSEAGAVAAPTSPDVADEVDRLLLGGLGAEFEAALAEISGVVVVPSGPVASVPWGSLSSMRGLPVVVASSATAWALASARPRDEGAPRVVVIAGPNLDFAEREVEQVGRVWGKAAHLVRPKSATIAAVLAAIEESDLVHIAAHGVFRADNPLLSAIQLLDGDVTGYDLTRVRHAPATVVLSACEVGMSESEQSGTFGLPALLGAAGVKSVIASVTPVGDESSVALMVPFHRALRSGVAAPTALVAARAAQHSARDSFVCFGS